MAELYFQWQNDILLKDIYPMRLVKLRDFLVFYKEADLWAEYKNKDISALSADVKEYEDGMDAIRVTAFKRYSNLKNYFMTKNARGSFIRYNPIEEEAMALIQKNHDYFIASWPKDIRGERAFIQSRIESFKTQIGFLNDRIRYLQRQLEGMLPEHPNRPKVEAEFKLKSKSAMPMLLEEMEKLRQFDETYDKVEKPKLEWYKLSKADPNFKTPEADFLLNYDPKVPVTVKDIVRLKAEQYAKTLEGKDQYQLLTEIRARFEKEPKRFPLWLQYMVVHFSGMRYKSAHGSWADPKDLLVRLRVDEVKKAQAALSDGEVEARCKEKIAQYEGAGANKPKLAGATEKVWKDRIAMHMQGVKANGPKSRRIGLDGLAEEEAKYEFMTMTTDQALAKLEAMKGQLPAWAWKMIVMLTPLRVKHVNAAGWETFTPEEDKVRFADTTLYPLLSKWATDNTGNWRAEHGRTSELIVTRAVCNETAEHVQHIRGHLPPGGLTENAARYFKLFKAKTPGVTFIRPTGAEHYTQGASIFWLRFVNSEPSQWQIARGVEDANGVGLLSGEFLGKKSKQPKGGKNAAPTTAPWSYKMGEVITRSRTTVGADKKQVTQNQWLRWIHEATVIEVVDTADGTYVYTFETSLPDDFRGTSCLGVFRNSLNWNLDDGTEDYYNRSFTGFVPEGQVPMEQVKTMLDWKKILVK
jgi:hypothetical protein